MSKKQKSVSDQLNDLINPTPVHFDPEEDIHTETAAKVAENDYDEDWLEDTSLSQYRKQNADLIEETDERYTGKKVSRKTVIHSDDSGEEDALSEGETSDVGDDELVSEEGSEEENDVSGGGEESNDDEENDDEEDDEDYSIAQAESKDDSFRHLARSKAGEVEKGISIRNQLALWDQLLEARIRLQRCLALANRMPQPDTLPAFKREGGAEFVAQANQTKQSVSNLLRKLLALRTERLKSFSETKAIGSSRKRSLVRSGGADDDEEITSSEDERGGEQQEAEGPAPKRPRDPASVLAAAHSEFSTYRDATIQRWNDKTRVAVGNVNSRSFAAFEQSTLRQIQQILADQSRLVARTQLKRSSYKVLGKAPPITTDKKIQKEDGETELEIREGEHRTESLEDKTKEHDAEVFDDDDFYHQLLRELIERKAVDVTDPVQLGRQWLELQKIRSKMKRKVDMRATKGRKLRYTVHPKLVNFAAPVSHCDWTEEAKTDLFNSLFGKTLDSAVTTDQPDSNAIGQIDQMAAGKT